jgi:hypothetical protein
VTDKYSFTSLIWKDQNTSRILNQLAHGAEPIKLRMVCGYQNQPDFSACVFLKPVVEGSYVRERLQQAVVCVRIDGSQQSLA